MFERIVAAIDNDVERASQVLEATEQLGQAFHSRVLVAHIRDVERPAAVIAATPKPGALPPLLHVEEEDAAEQLVRAAVARLRRAGVDAQGQIGPGAGSRARELLDIAEAHQANLIIVGDRDSRVTDVLLGGVSHRIVHLAACPVLLVR